MTPPNVRARRACRSTVRGAAMIEFALVCLLALMLVFLVIEVGRLLLVWHSGAHAAREGARLAAMCEPNASNEAAVKQRVADASLGAYTVSMVTVDYDDPVDLTDPCTAETCKAVRVTVSELPFRSVMPFVPVSVTLPPVVATLRREAMVASCS
jgi:Flp pilus assembly protein TadG